MPFGAQKKWNNGLCLKEIPEILSNLVKIKAKELLQELSHIALKALTGEKDIIKEKKEPSFNQLLEALMKVPPPKK